MARATLIHNTAAGDGRPTAAGLRELVERQGYDVCYATAADDLDPVLQEPGDLVVVAGGDGTVGRVAARLAGRDVPLAILPIGTANNIAAAVDAEGPLDRLAQAWHEAVKRRVDVVTAHGPWGTSHFVESFGLGAFAHAMPIISALKKGTVAQSTSDRTVDHDRKALHSLVRRFLPERIELTADGLEIAGDFILAELMNGPLLGPRLRLAPDATPGDGRLALVLVSRDEREAFADWIAGDPSTGWPAQSRGVRSVELRWTGRPLHIDGDGWAGEGAALEGVRTLALQPDATVRIEFGAGSVPVLAPDRRVTGPLRSGPAESLFDDRP